MDNKELTSAANALINWFNSQEISGSNIDAVLHKVIAKLLISRMPKTSLPDEYPLQKIIDTFTKKLVDEMNNRAYYTRYPKDEQ
jgi:hypothetical protein